VPDNRRDLGGRSLDEDALDQGDDGRYLARQASRVAFPNALEVPECATHA